MNPRIDDLIVLAALGELTDQEAQELDRAAQADPVVAADLADALSSAATLQSAAAEAPPAGLKLSVMDAIAGLSQEPPAAAEGSDRSGVTGPTGVATMVPGDGPVTPVDTAPSAGTGATDAPPTAPSPLPGDASSSDRSTAGPTEPTGPTGTATGSASGTAGSMHERAPEVRSIDSARSRRRFTPWIAAAAAAIVVVVGAVVVVGNGSDEDGRSAEIAAVIEADDAAAHSVAGEIGELEFVYSPSQNAFVLVGDSLELPPDEATYQVWLVAEDGQTSLGTFEPGDDGAMEMRADGIDPSGATIGITLEPVGGSEQPTLPMVAASVV